MSRQIANRAWLVALFCGAVIVTSISAAPAHTSQRVASGDVASYTAPRTGVVANAGVTGRAMIVTPSGADHTIVRIHGDGLQPGEEYGVHVHFGACLQFQGHFQYQSPGPVTRENEIWLDLIANPAGRASDQVKVPQIDIGARPLSIVIHARSNPDHAPGQPGHPGSRVACADFDARS